MFEFLTISEGVVYFCSGQVDTGLLRALAGPTVLLSGNSASVPQADLPVAIDQLQDVMFSPTESLSGRSEALTKLATYSLEPHVLFQHLSALQLAELKGTGFFAT